MYSQHGSVEGKKYSVPCSIEKVYFIDLNEETDEDIVKEQKLINDSIESGVRKNVFFMKDGKVKESRLIGQELVFGQSR